MDTAIILTDAGRAYIKALGNKEGPHALACELVGTKLAAWFGLPTFELAILNLQEADLFPLSGGREAEPGSAFVTREVQKRVEWDRSEKMLQKVSNAEAIARVVVFDTWLRNDDRYPPQNACGERQTSWKENLDNVFLTVEGAPRRKLRFIAFDFGRAVRQGHDLSERLARIDAVKDESVYGLYPEFRSFVTRERLAEARRMLRSLDRRLVVSIVDSIPEDWKVDASMRRAIVDFVCDRACYLADTIVDRVMMLCCGQYELPFDEGSEGR